MAETDSQPKDKDDVYRDRNLLALSFLNALRGGPPSPRHAFEPVKIRMGWWPDTDDVNSQEWAVVWADLPSGQVGWHIRREDVPEWLPKNDPEYDGYTTAEKNDRLRRWIER